MDVFKRDFIRFSVGSIILAFATFTYLDISTMNLGNKYSLFVKFAIIFICFLMTLTIREEGFGSKDRHLLQAARFFTVVADYFMVIKDENKVGILAFCIVQILYIIRHTENSGKKIRVKSLIALTLVPGVLLVISANMLFKGNELLIFGLIYACLLLISLYCALTVYNKKLYSAAESASIAVGMTMFFLCDINVGLYALTDRLVFGVLIWIFYAPSQLLLALSGFRATYLNRVFFNKG